MNVLVIPEDFRKDQFILKPIIRAMLGAAGFSTAKVEVCRDPLVGGISEALKWSVLSSILERYRWQVQLFILCVDRDGVTTRSEALRDIEAKAGALLGRGRFFLAENAWQELEVWILAGHDDHPRSWKWSAIRKDRDPKERYFIPFARAKGCLDHPGEGRGTLAVQAAARYKRIRKLCPEDIGNLETRIAALGL